MLVGTIFEGSHIPLGKWLLAIHMMCTAKNGVAAYELHRALEITNKSAWFMLHRIRHAIGFGPLAEKLDGVVEVDETYFGPNAKNLHADERSGKRGRGTDKIPVVTLVERGGQARSVVVRTVTAKNIGKVLHDNLSKSATLQTDSFPTYKSLGRNFAKHEAVNHSQGEYVRGTASTNTVEGFFGQIKRSLTGTHHNVSEAHLQQYLGEFDFRYNTRFMVDADRTVEAIRKTNGKRLTYR